MSLVYTGKHPGSLPEVPALFSIGKGHPGKTRAGRKWNPGKYREAGKVFHIRIEKAVLQLRPARIRRSKQAERFQKGIETRPPILIFDKTPREPAGEVENYILSRVLARVPAIWQELRGNRWNYARKRQEGGEKPQGPLFPIGGKDLQPLAYHPAGPALGDPVRQRRARCLSICFFHSGNRANRREPGKCGRIYQRPALRA